MSDKNSFFPKKRNRANTKVFIVTFVVFLLSATICFGSWFIPELFDLPFTTSYTKTYFEYSYSFWQSLYGPVAYGFFLTIQIISCLTLAFVSWLPFYTIWSLMTYKQWIRSYVAIHTEIINSANLANITPKVAMLVPVCNDFLPNTILQTADQTYKHLDVWILDDSNNLEAIKRIDHFCQEHRFHVLRRPEKHKKQHPSKIGNISYFVSLHGNEYEYIFENDSSTMVTPAFVENCLCYYQSKLIDPTRIGLIVCHGGFISQKNLIGYFYALQTQLLMGLARAASIKLCDGNLMQVEGACIFCKTSLFKDIELEKVECPTCDIARALFLAKKGYTNILEPFDFSTKSGPTNMIQIEKQRLKWNGGDAFVYRTNLWKGKFNIIGEQCYAFFLQHTIVFSISFLFIINLIKTVFNLVFNFFYFNLTSIIITGAVGFIAFAIFLFIVLKVNHIHLNVLISFFLSGIFMFAITFKHMYQIFITGLIRRAWSSKFVVKKSFSNLTRKVKIKNSIFDLCVIVFNCLVIGTIYFLFFKRYSMTIVLPLLLLLCGPSLCYLVLLWFGEIRLKIGYDENITYCDFWTHDYRYNFIKNTQIWQNKNEANIRKNDLFTTI